MEIPRIVKDVGAVLVSTAASASVGFIAARAVTALSSQAISAEGAAIFLAVGTVIPAVAKFANAYLVKVADKPATIDLKLIGISVLTGLYAASSLGFGIDVTSAIALQALKVVTFAATFAILAFVDARRAKKQEGTKLVVAETVVIKSRAAVEKTTETTAPATITTEPTVPAPVPSTTTVVPLNA